MANSIQWTAIENSQSQVTGKHIILVAYQSTGMRQNEVCAIVPMYDMRDMNLSGSVSYLEAGWTAATKLIDPLYVFGLMKSAGNTSCVSDAALQLNDYKLYNKAVIGVLEAAYKLRYQMLTAVMLKTFISTPLKLNLANTGLAELNKIGGIATFIVQQALEKAIMASVLSTLR